MALSTPASDTSLPTSGGATLAQPRSEIRGSSLWRDAWRRLLRNKLAVSGGVVIVLLCLIAMDPPSDLSADSIRDEKVKVLKALEPITAERLSQQIVRGS